MALAVHRHTGSKKNFTEMIPREILKKIRQIEIRTNRIVTETLLDGSFQPLAQFRRIPRAMPDGKDFDFPMFSIDGEVHRVGPRRRNFGLPGSGRGTKKSFGLVRKAVEHFAQGDIQPVAHSRLLLVIPQNRFKPVAFSFGLDSDREGHFLARKRSSISAKTCSTGLPRPGFFSASSARRSSSATCSGVSSGSNSSRRRSKTWYCSSNGSLWICSKTWFALMASKLAASDIFASA